MGKGYKGLHPASTSKWACLGSIDHLDECVWIVYAKPRTDKGWINYKIVAEDRAPYKANYWLGWNGSRFAVSSDYIRLVQDRPELAEAVQDFVREEDLPPAPAAKPASAEPDPDGLDLI